MVEVGWNTMKRAPTDKPNLDDVLARDFSELKAGEENLKVEANPSVPQTEEQAPALPKVYNQHIDAVEDREAFVVKPPAVASSKGEQKGEGTPTPVVLKAPPAQLGDDFDVDW